MIVLSKGGTPRFAVLAVDLHLIWLGLQRATGQPCSPAGKKETDPDVISGVREGEVCSSLLPAQMCADALPVPCPSLQKLQPPCAAALAVYISPPVSVSTPLG